MVRDTGKILPPASDWRLTTPLAEVPFRVISRSGWFSYEDGECTEEYVIPADRLISLVEEAFPGAVSINGKFYYPQSPTIGGLNTLIPKKVRWEAFIPGIPVDPFDSESWVRQGAEGDPNSYQEYIRVWIDYGTRPENDQEQDPENPMTFLEISLNASGMMRSCPQVNSPDAAAVPAQWVEDGDPVTEALIPHSIAETEIEWSLRWPRIPYGFWVNTLQPKMRAALGKVNSNAVTLLNNAPADTILLVGWSVSTQFTWRQGSTGANPINLSMKLIERNFQDSGGVQVTHQKTFRPGFGYRTLTVNGNNLFATTNMNLLW